MGKTFRPGHAFPATSGFTGSSGTVASISPYTRKVGKRALGSAGPVGRFAKTAAPAMGPPPKKPRVAAPAIPAPLGHSLTHRVRPITQQDAMHGGTSPLRPGFKKGGKVGFNGGGKC